MTDGRTAPDQDLLDLIRDVADFPKPGIVFKDIAPLLADATAFARVVDGITELARTGPGGSPVTKVAGIEARGFILAAPVAYRLGVGLVPVRKSGKLPGATLAASYALEYGEATLEIPADGLQAHDQVFVVDDVLATGGTLSAAIELVRRAGADVAGAAVLLELGFLDGRARLAGTGVELHTLLTV
ncbi:MAG: adenine phosphoribosyltransferase [Actinomycetota bacterium]|nr:adenine phosphoribosyltransferase [Actinomycetota bacterium]